MIAKNCFYLCCLPWKVKSDKSQMPHSVDSSLNFGWSEVTEANQKCLCVSGICMIDWDLQSHRFICNKCPVPDINSQVQLNVICGSLKKKKKKAELSDKRPWTRFLLTGRQQVAFPRTPPETPLSIWMSEMTDSSSPASRCQLLQKGRGRKAAMGPPTSYTLAPDACQAQRKESRVLPLCSRQTWLVGLPSDKTTIFFNFFFLFFFLFSGPTLWAVV